MSSNNFDPLSTSQQSRQSSQQSQQQYQQQQHHPSTLIIPNISPLPPRSPLITPGGGTQSKPLPSFQSQQQQQHQQYQQQQSQQGESQWANNNNNNNNNNNSINRSGLTPRSPQTFSNQRERDGPEAYNFNSNSPDRSRAHGITTGVGGGIPVEGFVRIKIMGLEKNRKDVYIKFNAESNLPSYRKTVYRSISRSYTEFTRLVDAISATCPQSIVPALPLAQTSAGSDEEEDRVVKANFQKWVARITGDKAILKDEELRSFIESEFGYTPNNTSRRRTPATFHMPRGPKLPDEQDDELTIAKASMSRLEANFLESSKSVMTTARARRQVASVMTEVGDHMNDFATTESYTPLANGIKKLGRSTKVIADLMASQSSGEQITLGDVFEYQARNAKSAKDTLVSRDVILDEHRSAAKSAISKRRAIEKLKGSSSIKADRVDDALQELDEAMQQETLLSARLVSISSDLLPSLQTHSIQAHEDLLQSLLNHSKTNLQYEKLILKELELLLPELKMIKKPEVGVYYHSGNLVGRERDTLGNRNLNRGSVASTMSNSSAEGSNSNSNFDSRRVSSTQSEGGITAQPRQQYQASFPQYSQQAQSNYSQQHQQSPPRSQSQAGNSTRSFDGTQSMYSASSSNNNNRNSLPNSISSYQQQQHYNNNNMTASTPGLGGERERERGGRSIQNMADNVIVQPGGRKFGSSNNHNGGSDGRGGGRQRVDAKMAASMLSSF